MRPARKLICMMLIIVLTITCLPTIAQAQSNYSLTPDENGIIYFETFEDLQKIAAKTYGKDPAIYAYCWSSSPFEVKKSLKIPENLHLIIDQEIVVPKGVTLSASSSSVIQVNSATINGTVTCGDFIVNPEVHHRFFILNGSMSTSGYVYLYPDDYFTTGAEKIQYTAEDAGVIWSCWASNEGIMKKALTHANNSTDPHWQYVINIQRYELVFDQSLTIPANCSVYLEPAQAAHLQTTISEGCILTVNGYLNLTGILIVQGTLWNNGIIEILNNGSDQINGTLSVQETGKYSGPGYILVASTILTDPQSAIPGLDISQFTVTKVPDSSMNAWVMVAIGQEISNPTIIRLSGSNRYKTALKAADELKSIKGIEKFNSIIVTSGENFADALSGSYLAAVKGAPILLVNDNTVKTVKEYINANLISGGTVYLLGGTSAVPEKMETGLDGFQVKRLGGKTRYDTNLLILQEAGIADKDLLVCTGKSFGDSLSASALGLPILLVKDDLTAEQAQFISDSSIKKIAIIGGEKAVNERIDYQIFSASANANKFPLRYRIAGANRYETSVLVAESFFTKPNTAVIAYGENFPDGLCGGPIAYALGAPLILTRKGKEIASEPYIITGGITTGYVLGGTTVLPEKTVNKVFGIR